MKRSTRRNAAANTPFPSRAASGGVSVAGRDDPAGVQQLLITGPGDRDRQHGGARQPGPRAAGGRRRGHIATAGTATTWRRRSAQPKALARYDSAAARRRERVPKRRNAMAGDPPLDQVVTAHVGGRHPRRHGRAAAAAGASASSAPRTKRHPVCVVAQTGFGYFKEFRRDAAAAASEAEREQAAGTRDRRRRLHVARRDVSERRDGQRREQQHQRPRAGRREGARRHDSDPAGRSDPDDPAAHAETVRGRRRHGEAVARRRSVGVSSSFARGNENNRDQPDGVFYLGPGTAPGYAIVNLGARYQVNRSRLQVIAQINNLFDRHYYTTAQLGPAGFTDAGTFIARPFPAVNGGDFRSSTRRFSRPGLRLVLDRRPPDLLTASQLSDTQVRGGKRRLPQLEDWRHT